MKTDNAVETPPDAKIMAKKASASDVLDEVSMVETIKQQADLIKYTKNLMLLLRRDIALVVNRLDASAIGVQSHIEYSTLKGVRREQFAKFCEIKKANPSRCIMGCARAAIKSVPGKGGYFSTGDLVRYANRHRSWWMDITKTESR